MSEMADPAKGDDVPPVGWVPVRWTWNGGVPVVDWCGFGETRLSAPFFDQSVHEARQRDPAAVCRTDAGVLTRLPDDGSAVRPAGLIFHLSRCGSTLLAQTLAAFPENIVVSEAQVVDEILSAELIFPGATAEAGVRTLGGLARAFGRRRFAEERRLFFKFDTWHILHFERIRAAFPGVPWVFLYRDPVEVLVSQLTEVSGRMLPGPMSAGYLGVPLPEALQTAQEEWCARALGRIAEAGARAARSDPELGRVVNYTRLSGMLEELVASWMDARLDDAGRESIRQATRFHSKSPGRLFTADSGEKQRLADGELREVVERRAGPAYRALEALQSR